MLVCNCLILNVVSDYGRFGYAADYVGGANFRAPTTLLPPSIFSNI